MKGKGEPGSLHGRALSSVVSGPVLMANSSGRWHMKQPSRRGNVQSVPDFEGRPFWSSGNSLAVCCPRDVVNCEYPERPRKEEQRRENDQQ